VDTALCRPPYVPSVQVCQVGYPEDAEDRQTATATRWQETQVVGKSPGCVVTRLEEEMRCEGSS
jgi:hypothetical protein